ncbi:alpha-ketoacid dehydrogenase subunit alpha/beta [Rhodoflexus caldus]|uniref:alpha-ketoacid dehydrogenase subunit alpha/beta n=1 Tax=Rhodoflexus caldus TaxID=2891236 RepID=UPI002029D850|nr:alpha-ketoacid dehydrogenase subunit alpha/beta [Rhodoflexus caldus]
MAQTEVSTANFSLTREEVLNDYRIACESRHASLMGRKEVFMGKAKFGIFGDGKEIAQIAMAKAFRKGDFRSGYYRDQTFMFALGALTLEQYFAQLYAHTDIEAEPATGGRCMNGHFATRSLDKNGKWKNLMEQYNSSADISCTAGQMPRLVGLAFASKLYRQNPQLSYLTDFSVQGNEVAFGTIGNASTSEGLFFEALNAAGVLQVPMVMSVWDDGYGISVPQEYHTTKGDIYKILIGLQRTENEPGFELFQVKGWQYDELCQTYLTAAAIARREHVPCLIHVTELTQPQGHSTSGSHERYKSKERLAWEAEYDCIKQMGIWMMANGYATAEELEEIDRRAKQRALEAKNNAWAAFVDSMKGDQQEVLRLLAEAADTCADATLKEQLLMVRSEYQRTINPQHMDAMKAARHGLRLLRGQNSAARQALINWVKKAEKENERRFNSHLLSESDESALLVREVKPVYSENSPVVDGREVLQACFDAMLARDPRVFAIGEDVGKIGDVNQAFAGLQAKYGELRVGDTGIREATIVGQGIGAAMRGLRPITEIQYLDYLLYAIQTLSDDLACLHYRTAGGQKAPLIVRTRGHRLEGIWHSGSPIGMIINSLRGMHVLVPRNMTQAAGMYNTLLLSDEPALVIECLNGYRLKERLPDNVGEFTVPLGVPEVIRQGTDITIVTYGSMCRIVMEAAEDLAKFGIDVEVVDVQTLLPFDRYGIIGQSVRKTNRVIFADEDVPGGASAYMLQQVMDNQDIFPYLDAQPVCIAAKAHRPPYGSDGDYFSKPNPEDIFDAVYSIMHEVSPTRYPEIY